MSLSSTIALRKAIIARLHSDAAFVAALGGPKAYDEAPRGTEPPYVVFAESVTRDWSFQESRGAEHIFALGVVSTARGVAEALAVGERAIALLDEAALTLVDHRLVDLRWVATETRREQNGRFARVNLRFRAATEVGFA